MFIKNDNGFICKNCNAKVEKLGYTSRDHCNKCLFSLHVDITPGDRENDCLGLLEPVNVIYGKKTQIEYICKKCGKHVKNVVAKDDNEEELIQIIKRYAMRYGGIK